MSLTVEKCLQGWTNSLRQMNARADVVFFGDSLIYNGDFASVLPDKVVCNLGLRGDTLQGMNKRVEQINLLNPRIVYLMAGINDVASKSFVEFREQYESLIRVLKAQNPTTALVVFSMLPVNDVEFKISCNNEQIARCNEEIVSLCMKHGVSYIDLFVLYEQCGQLPNEMTLDGIHLIQSAYHLWYNALTKWQQK